MRIDWFDRDVLNRAIRSQIRHTDVVLDVGCGIRPQEFFRPHVAILSEPCEEYVQVLQRRFENEPHVVILKGTWQQVLPLLPDRSVDSIFLIDVIEHLEKEQGRVLLRECERLVRVQVLVFTPLGFAAQDYDGHEKDAWGLGGAKWQVHKSGWTPEDFDDSWQILASKAFHLVNGKGEPFDPPFGAFWAIRNSGKAPSLLDRLRRRSRRTWNRIVGFLRRNCRTVVFRGLRVVWRAIARKGRSREEDGTKRV